MRHSETLKPTSMDTDRYNIETSKPQVRFGGYWGGDCPLFERHRPLRKWSHWEHVLFAFPTPSLVPDDYVASTRLDIMNPSAEKPAYTVTKRSCRPGQSKRVRFTSHVLEVLACGHVFRGVRDFCNMTDRKCHFLVSRIIHGLVVWISYVVQILFPLLASVALFVVFTNLYCVLHVGECSSTQ